MVHTVRQHLYWAVRYQNHLPLPNSFAQRKQAILLTYRLGCPIGANTADQPVMHRFSDQKYAGPVICEVVNQSVF